MDPGEERRAGEPTALPTCQRDLMIFHRWGLGGLRGEEQADCLIHQSTDPALLGRMYPGWGPVH